jgi:hypothetical protein
MAYLAQGSGPPHFDGKNYQMWQRRMAALLCGKAQTLWDVMVITTFIHLVNFLGPGSRDMFDANNKVVDYLYRALCQSEFNRVQTEDLACRIWEAVTIACHVGNQIFLRAFLNKTCYELMHGRAPRVSHFRAFGCRCFIFKKCRLDNFESRSSNGIFLGYASHSRAFWVLDIDTNLVMETCEVTFNETQPCNLSVFECAGDDEVVKKIFEDEEDDAGEDDDDDGEVLATHVPSTSTTTTKV